MKTGIRCGILFCLFILNPIFTNAQILIPFDNLGFDSSYYQSHLKIDITRHYIDSIKQFETIDSQEINKYLVLRSKEFIRKSMVFEEHKRLLVKSKDGRKMRGRLLIYDDSTIALYNINNGMIDTFYLENVLVVKDISLFSNVLSGVFIIAAPALFIYGVILADSPFLWDQIDGLLLSISGFGSSIIGTIFYNGFGLHRVTFNYHIYQAKGFKLKSKMVKYIYPL